MKQIILLQQGVPPALLDLLADHLHGVEPQRFLLASRVTDNGQFFDLDILPSHNTEDEGKGWRVSLPMNAVLAIAQYRPSAKRQIGFVDRGAP